MSSRPSWMVVYMCTCLLTLRYSAFFPVSSATPRGENTGRMMSSNVAVSSPVSVFTTASPFPSLRLVTFGMVTSAGAGASGGPKGADYACKGLVGGTQQAEANVASGGSLLRATLCREESRPRKTRRRAHMRVKKGDSRFLLPVLFFTDPTN